MNDIDELAHQSSASARASVAHLAVPPTPGRSVLKPVLRIGAIGAVVAGLIFVFLILPGGGPTPTDVSGAPTTEPAGSSAAESTTYFELDVPDGWTLSVSDGSNDTSVNATFAYGAGTASDPFANADVMISVVQVPTGFDPGLGDASDIMVRGHSAMPDESADGVAQVSWLERDDLVIGLSSRHYGPVDLVAIADDLKIDGFKVTLPAAPDGMALVSSLGITEPGSAGSSVIWGLVLTNVNSESDAGQSGFVHVLLQAAPEGKGSLQFLRFFSAENPTDVTVRGTPGVMSRTVDDSGGQQAGFVAWVEDGEVFTLYVSGPDDPIAIANSLRRIDRARFVELLAANPTPTSMPPTTMPPTTSPAPTTMHPTTAPAPPTSDPQGPPGPAVTIVVP